MTSYTQKELNALTAQGDELVEKAKNLQMEPPWNLPGDEHYLFQDKRSIVVKALKNYESAYYLMQMLPIKKEIMKEYEAKLEEVYSLVSHFESYLFLAPSEKIKNPRIKRPQAIPRPLFILPPTKIERYLEEIDDWLKYGESPPLDLLKNAVDEGKEVADMTRMSIACALLDDLDTFEYLVKEDYASDHRGYKSQKACGVGYEDLGPKPSYYISARRLYINTERFLEKWDSPISQKICEWLKAKSGKF